MFENIAEFRESAVGSRESAAGSRDSAALPSSVLTTNSLPLLDTHASSVGAGCGGVDGSARINNGSWRIKRERKRLLSAVAESAEQVT